MKIDASLLVLIDTCDFLACRWAAALRSGVTNRAPMGQRPCSVLGPVGLEAQVLSPTPGPRGLIGAEPQREGRASMGWRRGLRMLRPATGDLTSKDGHPLKVDAWSLARVLPAVAVTALLAWLLTSVAAGANDSPIGMGEVEGVVHPHLSTMDTAWWSDILRHPITIVLITAVVSGLVVPLFIRQSQERQKELELKTYLISQVIESVMAMVLAVQFVRIWREHQLASAKPRGGHKTPRAVRRCLS